MNRPRYFFETVLMPNWDELKGSPGDERCATNAILTADAFFGILHRHLRDLEHPDAGGSDSAFREDVAERVRAYRIVRDTAYALKHGILDDHRKTPRLVRRAEQVEARHVPFGTGSFGNATYGGNAVFIQMDNGDEERGASIIEEVVAEARASIDRYEC